MTLQINGNLSMREINIANRRLLKCTNRNDVMNCESLSHGLLRLKYYCNQSIVKLNISDSLRSDTLQSYLSLG